MANIITKTRKRWAFFSVLSGSLIIGGVLIAVAVHKNEDVKTKPLSEYLNFSDYQNNNSLGVEYEVFNNKEFFSKLIDRYNEVILENYDIDPVRSVKYFSLNDKYFKSENVKGLKIHPLFEFSEKKYKFNRKLVKDLSEFTTNILKSQNTDKKTLSLKEKFEILKDKDLIKINQNDSRVNIQEWIGFLNLINLYYAEAVETIVKPAFVDGNYTSKDIEDKIKLSNFALNFIEWQLVSNSVEDDIKLAKIDVIEHQKNLNDLRVKNHEKIKELNMLNNQMEEKYNILLTQSLKFLVDGLREKNEKIKLENESMADGIDKKPILKIIKDLFNINQIKLTGNGTSTSTGFEKINYAIEILNYLIKWNKQFTLKNGENVEILDVFINDVNRSIEFVDEGNQASISPLTIAINVVYNLKVDKINLNDLKI